MEQGMQAERAPPVEIFLSPPLLPTRPVLENPALLKLSNFSLQDHWTANNT